MRRWGTLVALVLALTGCGGGGPVSEIDFDLDEYTIEASGSVLAAGSVGMTLTNLGDLPHTIVISTLDGDVLAASDVVGAGESARFVADLGPGEYEFTCRIVAEFDGVLIDHYELGMVTRLSVAG